MDPTEPIRLDAADLPDLASLVTDEDFRRMAERLVPREHAREAHATAAVAWKGVTESLRKSGGRRDYREGERAAFIERAVQKALADAEARAVMVARIAVRLKELKDASGAGDGGETT